MKLYYLIGRKTDLQQLIAFCDVRINIWKSAGMKEFTNVYEDMRKQFTEQLQEVELLLNSESENSGKNDADNSGKPV